MLIEEAAATRGRGELANRGRDIVADEVQASFNARATVYDGNRRFLIPNFDEYYSVGVSALSYQGDCPRVLDLGGGTGLSTAFLLERYPRAHVTLLDFSEEMLTVARERFKDNTNVSFTVGDYRVYQPRERFDIIISGLSIHHLTFEEKRKLVAKAFGLLEGKGEFFNADLVRCVDGRLEQEMQSRLRAFLRENMSEEEVQRFIASQRIDIPATLDEQLFFLRSAGFELVECLYRYWIYGVFYAQKRKELST
jgi:tRNA (cmo5U34)-methyltransferase